MKKLLQEFKTFLKRGYSTLYPLYDSCSALPFWNFCEIVNTGDLKYLINCKNYSNKTQPLGKDANEAWNKIIDEFSRLENSSHVDNLVIKTRLLAQYKNLYVYTKALIRQLMFITPDSGGAYGKLASESIRDLQNMGYNINVSSSKEYAKSIYAADKRSNYLVTRIKLTQKEVDSLNSSSKKGENKLSFDREVTIISSSLGFSVPNDLTLSTYCEYKKRIKERNKHYEKMKRKTRR